MLNDHARNKKGIDYAKIWKLSGKRKKIDSKNKSELSVMSSGSFVAWCIQDMFQNFIRLFLAPGSHVPV